MFQLESADYVRLTYESLRQAYEAHAEAAARLSRFSSYFRLVTLGLSGTAAVLAAIAISSGWLAFVIGVVIAAVLVMVIGHFTADRGRRGITGRI